MYVVQHNSIVIYCLALGHLYIVKLPIISKRYHKCPFTEAVGGVGNITTIFTKSKHSKIALYPRPFCVSDGTKCSQFDH